MKIFVLMFTFMACLFSSEAGSGKVYNDKLPLKVISALKKTNLPLFFMISGDGGWTSFDQSLAEALAKKGIPVVGLDAQKYFWTKKTPDVVAAELGKVMGQYMEQLGKEEVVLLGFSFGASIVPFVASRLSPELKSQLSAVLSMSPDANADFEIHIADMLNFGCSKGKYNVLAEMSKLKNVTVISFFGKAEGTRTPNQFIKQGLKVQILPGDHHYGNDFEGLSKTLINVVNR